MALPVRRQISGLQRWRRLDVISKQLFQPLQSPIPTPEWLALALHGEGKTDSEAMAAQSGSDGRFQGAPPLWLST